jgi:hypothetical protein
MEVFCRDRTESTDNTTEGTSLGEITSLTGFATFDEDLDRAVNGGSKTAVDCEGVGAVGGER